VEVLVAIIESATGRLWAFPRSSKTLVRSILRVRRLSAEWERRRSYRRDLNRLLHVGEYMIRDIGLTRDDALREIDKPFWQP
jgi:uncharacterized protein YjiS (DUF1127 family)